MGKIRMQTRKQKEAIVDDLAKKFETEKIAVFSRIRGVSVARISALRRDLKKLGAELRVAKKTLMKRALEKAGFATNPEELEGEVGVIFGYDSQNQVNTAKLIQKFRRENETFKILLGLLEKKTMTPEQVMTLAKLPPREQLLAMLAFTLVAPIRNMMDVLQGNQRNLVVVLSKIKSKAGG